MPEMDAAIATRKSKAILDGKIDSTEFLERIDFFRIDATRRLDPERRSEKGQFFTPSFISKLMASMFTERPQNLRIIDAGAGIGSLSAALIAEVCHWELKPESVVVVAYEIEPLIIDYLRSTFNNIAELCKQEDIKFSEYIFQEDFIAAGVAMINGGLFPENRGRFNCAIMNPPYHKISNNSKTRQLLKRVDIETTNLYTAFLWLVMKLLEPGGELVAITPRSFCNGPYFRPFRTAFFKSMTLQRVHIFESRKKAFHDDDVLQENVIIHAVKSLSKEKKAIISSSVGSDDGFISIREVEHDQLVHPDDLDYVIHIVPDEMAHIIGEHMRSLNASLGELNLSVSTGRVVDFRAKQLIRNPSLEGVVPLIYPAHFTNGFIEWPIKNFRKPDAIVKIAEEYNLLLPAGFYVVIKRFSSKEEKKRIVAAIYDPDRITSDLVGFENHLNYYHRNGGGIPSQLAKGLAAFLNSTLVDQYFRQFSGHTQVNATDLRSLKYPSEIKLLSIGARIGNSFPAQDELDRLVMNALDIKMGIV